MRIVISKNSVALHDDEVDAKDALSCLGTDRLRETSPFAKREPGTYDVSAVECPDGAWTIREGQLGMDLYLDRSQVNGLCPTAVKALGLKEGKTYALMMTRIGD